MKKSNNIELEALVFKQQQEIERLKQNANMDKIKEAQLLLKSSIESVKEILILSIDKNYKYLFYNDTHKEVMKSHYDKDIYLGLNIIDCVTVEEDRIKAKNNYDRALSGESFSIIEEYGGDTINYYESFFNPIVNDQNVIIGATVLALNVSKKVKAEKALNDNENRYKAMMANIGDVIGIIGLDGCVKYKSPNIEKLFGWSPDEFLGKDGFFNVHPDDRDRIKLLFESIFNTEQGSIIFEYQYRLKNGSYKWVELKGVNNMNNPAIEGILINYHEISEQKKAEQDLIKSETRFRSLFENINNSSSLYKVILNDQGEPIDYLFLEVNPEYERNIGLKASDLVGKTLLTVFPATETAWLDGFKEVFHTGKAITMENYSSVIDRYFELTIYVPQQGQLALIGSDITDRKKAEIKLQENQVLLTKQNKELLLAKEKAEESDHLKTAFLQNMSHEIRTPMNAIYGFSEMLGDPGLSSEKQNSFIAIIQNSSQQLLSIVNDILTIASVETRQEKITIQSVPINSVIKDLLSVFEVRAANKNIQLIAHQGLSDQQSEIYTDKTKVTQILTNLLSNALKFTHKGKVEFGYKFKGKDFEFFVKDSGIGIKQELQDEIFKRFRKADMNSQHNYGGTGLGLAISEGFTDLLKGKIWVKSELGKGTTMFFTIPYEPVNKELLEIPKSKSGLQTTILVAEDELYNFLYIEEVLNTSGVNIIHTKNGQETVDACKSHPEINLVLMDIKMPGLNGFEAAKQIKRFSPDLKIIAQSAYAGEYEKNHKDVIAFDDYICKPIQAETLKNMVALNI